MTTHKPKEMMNENLVKCTEERNNYIHSTKIDTTIGLYQTFHLKPCTTTKENTEILCQCGTKYHTQGIYKDMGIHTIPYTKGAEEKAIFMYSTATTAGDEIEWDFVTLVITKKSSFSAFCKEMTRKYKTTNVTLVY